MPPTWSMCACVSSNRRTGAPSLATAAANGSHCERTMSVSTTVRPSSSAITPALLTPDSPPGWIHTHTRRRSRASVRGWDRRATTARYPSSMSERIPQPAAPLVPLDPRIEREDAGKGPESRRRHGVPRPRGRGRAAREAGRARQDRERDQHLRLGREPSCASASTPGTPSGRTATSIADRRAGASNGSTS